MSDPVIRLTVTDTRMIFSSLAELPFKTVFELIGKINRTTNETKPVSVDGEPGYAYQFTGDEMDLIVRALGQRPFHEVNILIRDLTATRDRAARGHAAAPETDRMGAAPIGAGHD